MKINGNDIINKLLTEYNISINDLVKSGMEMCILSNKDDRDRIITLLEEVILKSINNPNVSTLLICAMVMDKEGKNGNLPFDYDKDPTFVYVDEVIGMAIANEISGTKGIFNFKWYDAKKPGIIGKLDKEGYMFLDDAIAGLVAGCMSKTFEILNNP